MVADPEVVRDRESRIRGYLRDLRDFSTVGEAQFLTNRERQYAVLHALQLAVEAATDIATHICAADDLGTPASYAEAFDLLARASVLDPALATDLQAMARFPIASCTSMRRSTSRRCTASSRSGLAISSVFWLRSSGT